MKKKILILSASPTRDKVVDELIAEELKKLGNDVWVKKCLREGRDAVLEIKPNVVVVPPIRNPYSRDLVEQLKKWGCGVVSRHTEPSCDWQDYKRVSSREKHQILGAYPYFIDAELVWSQDEAEILNKRAAKFKTYPIGATTIDVYVRQDLIEKATDRQKFNAKYKFDKKKKNLLITSPWGFADSAPDLEIDENKQAKIDIEGRDRHLAMIRDVCRLKDKWNILVSVHPGVAQDEYKKVCGELGLSLDVETISFELIVNSDALIHAGSTMAINAHFLNMPAYQYGDVNAKDVNSWWGNPESAISQVSPYFKNSKDLIIALKKYRHRTNANRKALENLENGRYGKMDGKSTKRAADIITTINGEFKFCWPDAVRDYDQATIMKSADSILDGAGCGICRKPFVTVKMGWLKSFAALAKLSPQQKFVLGVHNSHCPNCGARFYRKDMTINQ